MHGLQTLRHGSTVNNINRGELYTTCTVTGGSLGSVSGTAVVVADLLLPVKGMIESRVDEVL